ncbi:hypothetical protein DTO166G4_3367 [Paecilomyces variotii]|nr:hypothetical protein DTO166G4_3367 [Paecilomyces variotii]KAJ9238480.1 hypothetical protein DTO166G5_3028 [Paecilomyces variotii]KAJ9268040.1 hypothetical protein DTO195F2_374 [Paecilomyces variotii]KAJ9283550.1 hypothetical protein DTO021C3_8857 [Paecilomyces variotii]KAJ9373428.1 hypothetical protein DTO282E5_1879 [Paecilomyces variotii]
MSTTSLYEPDEDEEASDSDVDSRAPRQGFPASSPPLQGLRIESSDESGGENRKTRRRSRSSKGLRYNAHRSRRRGFTKEAIESYRHMLTEMINDVSTGPKFDEGETHHPSQNGAVTWSSSEKNVFFNVLARKGTDGIREISNAIGTKSELEVLDYIKLLQAGLERQHLLERHPRSIVLGDVPAAAEVSPECCEALDEFAEILALEEQASEDTSGRKKHHDNWIIDREKAEQIEQQLETQESSDNQAESSIALSASLLNISKWIKLSERCFMNFGGSRIEDNWVNIAYADESPSLTSDAFADFYALAVSITRRLVQSSIFFAMSRIRDVSWSNREISRVVRLRDVRAALDVLNMKSDTFDFWIGAARRCNLEVADIRHRKGWTTSYMSYDEVENALSGSVASRERSVSRHPSENQTQEIDAMEEEEEEEESSTEEMSEALSSPGSEPRSDEDEEMAPDPETLEDTHAEYLDEQISKTEELRIWQLIGHHVPSGPEPPIKLEDGDRMPNANLTGPRKPVGERKRKEDLVDWRDRVLYRSEWEEYGYEIFEIEDELDQNRRKRRRVEDTRGSKSSTLQVRKWRENIDHDSSDQNEHSTAGMGDTTTDAHEGHADENEDDQSTDLSDGGMELDPTSEASAHHILDEHDHDHDHEHERKPDEEDSDRSQGSHPPSSSGHGQPVLDPQGEEEQPSPMSTGQSEGEEEEEIRPPLHSGSPGSHELGDSE